ncbi:MAG: acyltransferase [Chloroflexi bacterium]|nr:acyltransferase [Chloroflexota bacterium]
MNLSYRKDIDGLRAISVLAVLFNHAGISWFSGGYIGVDIFFVISGYLITSIIFREIQSNQFSLIRFYERRIRRILPALLGLLVFTVTACAMLYDHDTEKFKEFGKSVIATALFVSNINFWKEAGYFSAPSQLKPLLHTWSLAVEEQFYILYPLFMFAIYRYAKKMAPFILTGVAILSFGFAVYTTLNNPSTAFYLFHLRAWELLIGGMLALNFFPTELGKKYSNLIGFMGLALTTVPIFLYTKSTAFPGLAALAPVLGAVLILFSGMDGKSLVARFLSISPLVFIGQISYSLYLWHWPLVIFVKYYKITPLTPIELGLLILMIILISALSWHFVETPFRSKQFLSTKQIFTFGASTMVLMLMAGVTVYGLNDFLSVVSGREPANENKKGEVWKLTKCNINYTDNPTALTPCDIGEKSKIPSFMIMGDSHSPSYGKAIHTSAVKNNISGLLTYAQMCPTLLDMAPVPRRGDVPCVKYNHMAISFIQEHPEIKTVILAARWTLWLEESGYGDLEQGYEGYHVVDTINESPPDASNEYLFTLGLERTIKALTKMDRQVVIIAPLPEIGYDVPSANYVANRTGRDINALIAPTLDEYLSRNQRTFAILEAFKQEYGIQLIEPWKMLCVDGKCRVAVNGIPLYGDDDHLSIFGSELISPIFDPLFAAIKDANK